MDTTDHILRACLFAGALAAVLMYGPMVGHTWHDRAWPTRTTLVGGLVILVYVLAGQVKAFNLNIAFDGFSAVGLIGVTIFDTGLLLVLKEQRRHDRG